MSSTIQFRVLQWTVNKWDSLDWIGVA